MKPTSGVVWRFLGGMFAVLAAVAFSLPGGMVLFEMFRQMAELRPATSVERAGAVVCTLVLAGGLFSTQAVVCSTSWAIALMGHAALANCLSPGRSIDAQLIWLAAGATAGAVAGLGLALPRSPRKSAYSPAQADANAQADSQNEKVAVGRNVSGLVLESGRSRVTRLVLAVAAVLVCLYLVLASRETRRAAWQARVLAAVSASGGQVIFDDFAIPTLLFRWMEGHPGSVQRKCLRGIDLGCEAGDDQLAELIELGIARLPNLTDLRLHRSRVSDEGLARVADMVRLECLSLSRATTDGGLAHLRDLSRLRWLDLGRTQITGQGLSYPHSSPWLMNLNLRDTQIADADLPRLRRFPGLTCLDLSGTKVTDEGLAHLQDLPNLQTLLLCHTPVSDRGIPHLKRVPRLHWLFLDHTRVSEVGLRDFCASCPGVKVFR